jgi:hypothetical protein
MKVLFGDQWPLLKRVLTEDIAMAMDSYWDRVRREEKEGITISPAAEVLQPLPAPDPHTNPNVRKYLVTDVT